MLNEIQEAYEYTFDIENTNPRPKRIKWSIMTHNNDFNGLERCLTTVARKFIFDDGLDLNQGRRRAETAMRMWLGFTDGLEDDEKLSNHYAYLMENNAWLCDWLEDYLIKDVSESDKEKISRVENSLDKLRKKEDQFKTKSLRKKTDTNDYKLLRYDKILANAQVSRGPLKRYYLVCETPDWCQGLNQNRNDPNGTLNAADRDRVLKLLAAYLLERNRKLKANDDYVYEQINFTDIGFWSYRSKRLDGTIYNELTYEERLTHKKMPLFKFYSPKTGNISKAKPNEEWFEICGWDIIEATDDDSKLNEYLSTHKNAIFFSDEGGSKELCLNERYLR